jgi:uncharacterized protein (DUF2147 family)
MRTYQMLLCLFLGIFFAVKSYAQQADKVLGVWLTEDKQGKIQIYKQGNAYFGKIISGNEPNRVDDKNPDEKLRSRKLIGAVILSNFVFDGKGTWEDGKIYDPNNGKTYSCLMKFKNDNTLEIRGYVGIAMFGRTAYWTRSN